MKRKVWKQISVIEIGRIKQLAWAKFKGLLVFLGVTRVDVLPCQPFWAFNHQVTKDSIHYGYFLWWRRHKHQSLDGGAVGGRAGFFFPVNIWRSCRPVAMFLSIRVPSKGHTLIVSWLHCLIGYSSLSCIWTGILAFVSVELNLTQACWIQQIKPV